MSHSRYRVCIVAFVLFTLGSLLFFQLYGNNGYPILLEVPASYIGSVVIIEDATAPPMPLVDNQYVVRVPASGALRVQSLKAFGYWHQFKVRYSDGTPLLDESAYRNKHPDKVALRGGGSRSTTDFRGNSINSINYFIGTARSFAVSNDAENLFNK